MRGVISAALVLLYSIVGQLLVGRTRGHFREPNHRFWPLDLLRPNVFTERGDKLRRQALWFVMGGGVILVLCLVLLAST